MGSGSKLWGLCEGRGVKLLWHKVGSRYILDENMRYQGQEALRYIYIYTHIEYIYIYIDLCMYI